jgi:hypothetical protein
MNWRAGFKNIETHVAGGEELGRPDDLPVCIEMGSDITTASLSVC